MPKQNLYSNHPFSGAVLVSGRVSGFGGDLSNDLRQVAGCFSNTSASKASQLQVVRENPSLVDALSKCTP